jgi:circadian clock protein KaiC
MLVGGGLPARGLVFLVGAPGSGKTVLAQQLVFAAAQRGPAALYFSGISEPHDRLVEHVRDLAFFDEAALGQRVQLLSLAPAMAEDVDTAVDQVVQSVRRTRARFVVVDGFRGLRGFLGSAVQGPPFLYRLGTQLGLLGALVVVVLEGDPESEAIYGELPTADVILALSHDSTNPSGRRNLRILKRRGAAPLPGLHAYVIDGRGITCYPQLEAIIPPPRTPFALAARAPLALPELDAMLGGGLTAQSMTVVAGSLGTGKTLLGLKFLAAGVAAGEPGLLVSFNESYEQLVAKAAWSGFDLAAAEAQGLMHCMIQSPFALDADILAHTLQDTLRETGTRRLVVDSLVGLEMLVPSGRAHAYLAALVAMLRGYQVTALFTKEVTKLFSADVDFTDLPLAVLAENVLLLRQVPASGELRRVLAVLNMRFSDYDRRFHEFTITEQGLRVLGHWQGPLGLMAGGAESMVALDS